MSFTEVFNEFPVIKTNRLVLREIAATDIVDIFSYFSDDDVTKYLDFSSIKDIAMAERFVGRVKEGFKRKEIIRWAITIKGEEKLIGTCFLSDFIRESIGVLGYDLSKPYWNKGIMTEVLGGIVPFGFETLCLHRIQAIVNPQNTASIALLKKMVFEREGLLRRYEYHYDEKQFKDVLMYSKLKE